MSLLPSTHGICFVTHTIYSLYSLETKPRQARQKIPQFIPPSVCGLNSAKNKTQKTLPEERMSYYSAPHVVCYSQDAQLFFHLSQ